MGAVLGVFITWAPGSAATSNVVGDISLASGKVAKVVDVAVWLNSNKTVPVPTTKPVISQHDLTFTPRLLVIMAGQTVVMPNEDDVAHNVFSKSPARSFNLGIYSKGLSKEVAFSEPGVVDIECSMHRRMKATIIVSTTPYHTIARAGARFELASVPAGTYELRAWSAEFGEFRQQLTVTELGGAEVKVVLTSAEAR
jgi:plastocyanin